jgi:hypothetical protein
MDAKRECVECCCVLLGALGIALMGVSALYLIPVL